MKEASEKKIIEGCLKGDRKAQKTLFDNLAPTMMSVCLRYVGDRDVAQDLLQEGFISLFSKLDSYTGEGSFEGWARKIFVNSALMHLRKKDALKVTEKIDDVPALASDLSSQTEDIGYKELMELILTLPPGFRTVFNMFVLEGYTHKEIAEQLGITEVTSRTQLNRARAWLQNKIKER